jgi:hypothetical protein
MFGGAADAVPIAHTVWRWLVETVAWKLLWLVEIQPAERKRINGHSSRVALTEHKKSARSAVSKNGTST